MIASKLQLQVKGPEDKYLSTNPTNSLFQSVYHRLTNFSQDTHLVQPLAGQMSCNSRIEFRIPRFGDLLSNLYLNLTLSVDTDMTDLAWVNSVGYALIQSVDLVVGNNQICSLTGKQLDIWSEFLPTDKRYGVYRMVGKQDPEQYQHQLNESFKKKKDDLNLMIPIPFWFTKHISQAFPMYLVRSETLRLIVNINPIERCLVSRDIFNQFTYDHRLSAVAYFHYVVLDPAELASLRKNKTHRQQIIQQTLTQHVPVPVGSAGMKFKLDFDHPVKELMWVIQRDDRNEAKQDNGGIESVEQFQSTYYGNDEFNYSSSLSYYQPVSDTLTPDCDQPHLFTHAQLFFNNNPRTTKLPAQYFRLLQPFQHHTVVPEKNIYCYNFGLNADHYQPNGYCNLTPINSIQMEFSFADQIPKTITLYGHAYNLIVFEKGSVRVVF